MHRQKSSVYFLKKQFPPPPHPNPHHPHATYTITINLIEIVIINMEITSEMIDELQKKYNCFLIDQFYSTEHLIEAVTQTGSVSREIFQLQLSTGIQANSTAKVYYDLNRFNPHYSKAFFRLTFTDIKDTLAYIGFKLTYADPTYNMTETHSGLLIYNNKIYLTTGNEIGTTVGYQNTEISGIDLTKDFIIQIEKNKLSTCPLPQIIPYFDTFRIISPDRIFTLKATNSTYPPQDVVHYIMFFIKNSTNEDKRLTLRHFCYLEEYAD